MRIQVIFYGVLKQDAGGKTQTLELAQDAVTVHELKALLVEKHPNLSSRLGAVACAVRDELVGPDYCLHDGDEVALLPPVSGG
jgi:molybdopterin converting factor subunit 1